MDDPPFVRFGSDHLAAIGAVVVAATAAAWWARHRPEAADRLRHAVAAGLLVSGVGFVAVDTVFGVSWRYIAPLHLCDLAVFVGSWALFRRHQRAAELTWFWGLAGAFPAILLPDLGHGFPHHRFLFYFAQHGGIVVAALLLVVGLGIRPERGAPVRAWLWLNVVALGVGVVNVVFGTNFLYLRQRPPPPTPLDWFGPWPLYVLGAELLAIGSFFLLSLPFWREQGEA